MLEYQKQCYCISGESPPISPQKRPTKETYILAKQSYKGISDSTVASQQMSPVSSYKSPTPQQKIKTALYMEDRNFRQISSNKPCILAKEPYIARGIYV